MIPRLVEIENLHSKTLLAARWKKN